MRGSGEQEKMLHNARAEYAMLNRKLAPEQEALVLRKPQIAAVEAELQSARAALEQARLNLERTRVTAPFAGMVLNRSVDLGTRVTATTPIDPVSVAGSPPIWWAGLAM